MEHGTHRKNDWNRTDDSSLEQERGHSTAAPLHKEEKNQKHEGIGQGDGSESNRQRQQRASFKPPRTFRSWIFDGNCGHCREKEQYAEYGLLAAVQQAVVSEERGKKN